MAVTSPTSFRLHPDAVALIAAWTTYLSATKRRDVGRSEVLERFLADIDPPRNDGAESPELLQLQAAHETFLETR